MVEKCNSHFLIHAKIKFAPYLREFLPCILQSILKVNQIIIHECKKAVQIGTLSADGHSVIISQVSQGSYLIHLGNEWNNHK